MYVWKCLKLYQSNIIKKIKKDYLKKSRKRYQNLSKEEKEKKWQYGRERCKNLSEDEKQKLVEYRKNIIEWEKSNHFEILKVCIEIDKKLQIYFKKLILTKKVKNFILKKLWKILKPFIKIEKTIIKFGDIKIKKQKYHQYNWPI